MNKGSFMVLIWYKTEIDSIFLEALIMVAKQNLANSASNAPEAPTRMSLAISSAGFTIGQ
jgi:hypothetical protein